MQANGQIINLFGELHTPRTHSRIMGTLFNFSW
jgi:hypothetical protein